MSAWNPQANNIFLDAIEIDTFEDRNNFIDRACDGNAQLREQVDSLIAASQKAGNFLKKLQPAVAPVATLDLSPTEHPGTQIGPYKLLEQIGEGGMGSVYVAEQKEPVRRKVALKLIKPGMDTQQVVTRFEAERQALAMMNHPNIAKVLDAGATEVGRPYFVMELVKGVTITEFCEQHKLDVRKRLQLFITLCQAVQHAHQKGVIHRDLKPSNVLVEMHDVTPVPKVIDFGVAKAIGQQLTDRTLHTGFGQMIGTPLYMSPEQAGQSSIDVDTRSDVYSLGVLLYELLTGTTPFDKDTLSKAGFDEMRRMIREDDPPRPSARVSTHQTKAQSTLSQQRKTDSQRPSTELPSLPTRKPTMHLMYLLSHRRSSDPSHMSATLRGELDWIVMKALEKDRSRRYESASAFASDLQRYLSDEPVLACPPSTLYRFQKFARKHRTALAASVAIAISLIFGTTVSAWQAVRATTAEAQANANETQAKEAAAAEAQQRKRAEANEQKANANANQAQANAQEAKDQARVAATQRDEAQKQRDEVKSLNDQLFAAQRDLQRTLYASNMNLVRHAWEETAVARVPELLAQHRPKAGGPDLRGFEWHYYNRLCNEVPLVTMKTPDDFYGSSLAFSPDGKRLLGVTMAFSVTSPTKAASKIEPELVLWDAQTGQQLLLLKGGDTSAVFSPDGKRIASGSSHFQVPGQVKVWDAQTGEELLVLKGHTGDVTSLAFSPDGKHLASASGSRWGDGRNSGELKVWDSQTGKDIFTVPGRTGDLNSLAYSPDGQRLAHGISGDDKDGKRTVGRVKVRNAQTGQELLSLEGGGGSVAFSPDGKLVASRSGRGETSVSEEVMVWDAQTGQQRASLNERSDGTILFAFSPDGKRFVTASTRSTGPRVKVCDTESGREIFTFQRHTKEIINLVFSPDGKHLASNSYDQTVRIWDLETGQEMRTLKGNTDGAYCVAFSPDGNRLACGAMNGVKVWDARKDAETVTLKGAVFGQDIGGNVAVSPDFRRLAGAGADQTVKIWDAHTGQEILTLIGHSNRVLSVAFSPDGKRLASGEGGASGEGPRVVKVWNTETGRELFSLKGHVRAFDGKVSPIVSLAFSPSGDLLATMGASDVKIWNAQTGQELLTLPTVIGSPYDGMAFSPDGKRLASGGQMVKVWDAQTGLELLSLKTTGRCTAFSPDGKRLASGIRDNTVKVWDAETGQELLTSKGGHTGLISSVTFTRDGQRLTSADRSGTVKMWDSQSGHELLSFAGRNMGGVESLAFSPDGHRFASPFSNGTVKIYDATPLPEKP